MKLISTIVALAWLYAVGYGWLWFLQHRDFVGDVGYVILGVASLMTLLKINRVTKGGAA